MRLITLTMLMLFALPMSAFAADAPTWNRQIKLSDGRTFVTDGAASIDAAIAKPAELPKDVLPEATGKIIERYMAAELPNEYAVGELTSTGDGKYRAPSGVVLAAKYVDFLRSVLDDGTLRFRMKGDFEPVVVLSGGKAVGVVMPMKR